MSQTYDKCFVCGMANPIGLKLSFSYDEAGHASAKCNLSEAYEGYPGVIHGGIISTLLDEVMAKAVLKSGNVAFTANLTMRFRHPVPSDTSLHLEGWIVENKSRTIKTAASISDGSIVYAEAEAIFVVPR